MPSSTADSRLARACESTENLAVRTAERRQYRQPRGTSPSEKHGRPVTWTSAIQRDAMALLEVQHCVASYHAWPTRVALPFRTADVDYHPTLGATLADGRRLVIDLVHPDCEGTRERHLLDALLRDVLAERGDALVTLTERALRADRQVPNARDVMRACGWPVTSADEFGFLRLVAGRGGKVTLGELSAAGEAGRELRATACVLAMRRVLAIDVAAPTPDGCAVRLLGSAA